MRLRDHLPQAEIGWVVEERSAGILRSHRALDRLFVVPRRWLRKPSAVWRLRRELRAFRPQLAIDLQGLTKSALAAWISSAPTRIGMARPDGRELAPWLDNRLVRPTAGHVVDRYLELLAPLGITRPATRFDIPRNAEDEASVSRFIRDRGLGGGFALINPGAAGRRNVGRPNGSRPLPSIWARTGICLPWSSGPARKNGCGPIGSLPPRPAWRTWLRRQRSASWAKWRRRARLFIGSDTGPLHLAAAVGTPCVGLYGPVSAERNGPYGSQHVAVQKICLTGSSRSRRQANDASMRAISVQDVCTASDQLLLAHAEPQIIAAPFGRRESAASAA